MEVVEVVTRYPQERNVPLSSSRVEVVEVPTVSMNKNVASSAALSTNSSAPPLMSGSARLSMRGNVRQ